TQEGYATLTPSNDKTQGSAGYTFDFNYGLERKLQKLTSLLSIGVNANLKNNFSEFFKNDLKASDISFNLKYTYVGRGSIAFSDTLSKYFLKYQEQYLQPILKEEFDKYVAEKLPSELKRFDYLPASSDKEKFLKEKYVEQYTKIAAAEVKALRD